MRSGRAANGRSVSPANRSAAVAFYAVLALSVVVGIGLNFTPLDPIKALYWSAVINGVLAPRSWC